MRFETLKRIVLAKPNGTYSHIIWEKTLPVRKTFPGITVVKRTSGTVRTGINYDNMASVQLKRMSGELPTQNSGLLWGEWLTYPHFIQIHRLFSTRLPSALVFLQEILLTWPQLQREPF